MSVETIDTVHLFAVSCPSCKTKCWVNNGDVEDLTVSDVMAVYCWKCKHEFVLCDEDEEEDYSVVIEPTYQTAVDAVKRDSSKASAQKAETNE
jgi:hypothetical protein